MKDVLSEDNEDFDLTLLELIEGIFSYPKGIMLFIHKINYSKYVSLLLIVYLFLELLSGLLGLYPFDFDGNALFFLDAIATIALMIAQLFVLYFIFCCSTFLILRLDKIKIDFVVLLRMFVYSLMPWVVCMFIISIFKLLFLRGADVSNVILFLRYGVFVWSMVLFYYGLRNYTNRKVTIVLGMLFSLLFIRFIANPFQYYALEALLN